MLFFEGKSGEQSLINNEISVNTFREILLVSTIPALIERMSLVSYFLSFKYQKMQLEQAYLYNLAERSFGFSGDAKIELQEHSNIDNKTNILRNRTPPKIIFYQICRHNQNQHIYYHPINQRDQLRQTILKPQILLYPFIQIAPFYSFLNQFPFLGHMFYRDIE